MQRGSDPTVFSAFTLCEASAKRLLPKTLKAKSSCEQLGDVRELDAALALAWQAEQLCDHPFSSLCLSCPVKRGTDTICSCRRSSTAASRCAIKVFPNRPR